MIGLGSTGGFGFNLWVWVQLVSLGLHLVDVSLTGGFWFNFVSLGLTDRFGLTNMGQCHFVDLSLTAGFGFNL